MLYTAVLLNIVCFVLQSRQQYPTEVLFQNDVTLNWRQKGASSFKMESIKVAEQNKQDPILLSHFKYNDYKEVLNGKAGLMSSEADRCLTFPCSVNVITPLTAAALSAEFLLTAVLAWNLLFHLRYSGMTYSHKQRSAW